jgi:hypothetical protein
MAIRIKRGRPLSRSWIVDCLINSGVIDIGLAVGRRVVF